jgi:steroid 5-alpha reductase family enzyme
MWKTALFLIFTLIIVPLVAFYYGELPNEQQWEAIRLTLWVYLISAGICFVVSSLTDNYSQVDKLWSIMPVIYAWFFASMSEFEARLLLMAILITIWGLRLTYNFGRRGGYSWKIWSGEEDYRWAILRNKQEFQAKWKWVLFNLLFISFYQMGLIWLITLPMVKAMGHGGLNRWDYIIAVIVLFWVIIETIADQQQWAFQKKKYAYKNSEGPVPTEYERGFIQSGLWKYVRHPNYAAEQAVWISLYFFSVSATGDWLNWSIAGALLLILLFQGSSNFSESITASKYPDYKKYQKNIGRFLPF